MPGAPTTSSPSSSPSTSPIATDAPKSLAQQHFTAPDSPHSTVVATAPSGKSPNPIHLLSSAAESSSSHATSNTVTRSESETASAGASSRLPAASARPNDSSPRRQPRYVGCSPSS